MIVHLTGSLTCGNDADLALVRAHLPEHIRLSLAEPGCLSFNVTQGADPMVWLVDESFVDQAAFDAHQTRTRDSVWFAVTRHMPRAFRITKG